MPLDEEGAKWSCEPCVRGHRSSKCQHFDRMMMKVPKAGRPLAKCPHPKGSCSCQKMYAFMVRIPKGSTCLCRPLYKVPMAASETGQDSQSASQSNSEPTPPVSGPSPATPLVSPNAKSHRVQKRAKRQTSGRGLSEIAAKDLETLPNVAVDQTLDEVPDTPDLPALDPKYDTHFSTSAAPRSAYLENALYNSRPAASEPISTVQASHTMPAPSEKKSCCSTKSAPKNIPHHPAPSSSVNGAGGEHFVTTGTEVKKEEAGAIHNDPRTVSSHLPRSFSATRIQTPAQSSDIGSLHRDMVPAGGRFPNSISAPVTGYSSPTVYPQYRPMDYIAGPQNYPPSAGPSSQSNNLGISGDAGHNCGCGDGCQCLGCASHPFNDTTRQHIQEMGYLMTFRGDDRSSESPKGNNATPSYNDQGYPHDMGYSQFPMHTAHPPAQGYPNTFEHIAQPHNNALASMQTPTAQSQGGMMMQPGAYLTVEYPVGFLDPCSNLSGTCQCGINCACLGCLTHDGHNGISLEPSPPPENNVEFPMPAMGLPTPHNDPSLQMPMYAEPRNEYQPNPPP